uniref:Uncharacterized protein n=1 Tax=Anguilla anguilla TaxID=7936 RepID=A0A0E9RRY1_ANGAN
MKVIAAEYEAEIFCHSGVRTCSPYQTRNTGDQHKTNGSIQRVTNNK